MNNKLEAFAFKYRGALWGVFAASLFLFPSSYSLTRFALGIAFLVGGQLLRFWAAGLIPKYRTLNLDAPVLVTWGPYAYIRNPLYAGNGLMGLGWSVMAGWYWVVAFMTAFYVLYGVIIIPYEERFLGEKFGDVYQAYRKKTPPLIMNPMSLFQHKETGAYGFDRLKSWNMEKHSLRMNVLVTVILLFVLFRGHF